ncbi:MAG: hypothetical protein HC941_07490 [Microcoleus sp. SU_5_3]|nr:hypothetical protein [Microcoleus sp. SU_5_3]
MRQGFKPLADSPTHRKSFALKIFPIHPQVRRGINSPSHSESQLKPTDKSN